MSAGPTGAAAGTPADPRRHHFAPAEGRADFGPTCLVVGGAGFLGRALVRRLLERGYAVHVFDLAAAPEHEADERVTVFTGDIRDADAVRAAAEGCDTVFHTAAVICLLGIYDRATRDRIYGINVGGTANVIEACREVGANRLLYTSSHAVCFVPGPVDLGDESQPYGTTFIDLYAETKAEAEKLVRAADSPGGLRTACFRPGGLWGPGPGSVMLEKIVGELVKGSFVATLGDGSARSDNTHVDNLIHAQFLAAEKLVTDPDAAGGQAWFVSDDEPMNLFAWFRPLVEALGHEVPTRSVPGGLMYALGWIMEVVHRLGGPPPAMSRIESQKVVTTFTFRNDKVRADLGWQPIVQWGAGGLDECLPYCRELHERLLAAKG